MKIHPLPPLKALVVFEAAARHLSFTLAARELNVTQGAVSRQIHLLEDYLGQVLFTRTTREIHLSPTGNRYYAAAREALQQIAQATGEIRHWQGALQVSILTSTAMASLWLLPRVAEFQREHEEIDLRIITDDHVRCLGQELARLDADLVLYYCSTQPEGMHATALFAEEVFPVCNPEYLQRHGVVSSLDALAAHTWLWLEDPQMDWLGWPEWFTRLGHAPLKPRRRVNINSYSMLIQSALAGQGIALAWSNLTGDHLDTGGLVRPVAESLNTGKQFCLLEPASQTGGAHRRRSIGQLRDWLLAQAVPGESAARTPAD